jgi:hypothetical protein
VDVNALQTAARLSRVKDRTINDLFRCPGDVYVGADVSRIFPTELEAYTTVYTACGGALDCETAFYGTCEAD